MACRRSSDLQRFSVVRLFIISAFIVGTLGVYYLYTQPSGINILALLERSVGRTAVSRIHLLLALGLMAIGLVLVFDALSSHELELPLGLFAPVVGVIWLVGRIGWWIVWKDSD
jgi:hypothetical protein